MRIFSEKEKLSVIFPIGVISFLIIAFLSNDLYLPSMPALVDVFKTSENAIQATVTAWFLGSMILQLFMGPISDAYGRKPIFIMSGLILILGSLLCAYSNHITLFMLGRFLQGSAASGIMVVAFASVHEVYQKYDKSTEMLGYVGMGSALAPIFGPLLGGYLYLILGWRANFFIVAIFSIILLFLFIYAVPETCENKNFLNLRNAFKSYLHLIKRTDYCLTVLAYALLFFSGGAFLTGIAFIYANIFHLPIQSIGTAISPMLFCYVVAASMAGKAERKIGAHKLIIMLYTLLTLVMILFLLSSLQDALHLYYVIIPLMVFYFCLGLIGPTLNHLSLSCANEENSGCAAALLTFTMMLGSTLGSLLISLIFVKHLIFFSMAIAIPIFASFFTYLLYRYLNAELTTGSVRIV